MLDGPARITNPKVTGVVKLTSVNTAIPDSIVEEDE
mgnify:CR=1 FL=1